MAFERPGALLGELESTLPERPFSVEMWDGSRLPATNGEAGPSFRVRSPQAIAHALRSPGQLGIGRAYVAGDLEVEDLDAVMLELRDRREGTLVAQGVVSAARRRLEPSGVTVMHFELAPELPIVYESQNV